MDRIEIRRAQGADAAALGTMRADSALERSGGGPAEHAAYRDRCISFFATELARTDSFVRSWVALRDDVTVGSVSLALAPTLPRYGIAFSGLDGRLRDVYVVPEFRRSGIATALVKAALEEARRLKLDRLTLGATEMGRPCTSGSASCSSPMKWPSTRPASL